MHIPAGYAKIILATRPGRDTTTADGCLPLTYPHGLREKGVVIMVTYENLFAFAMVIIEAITLAVLLLKNHDK